MTDAAVTPRGPGRPARISRDHIVEAAVASGNLDTLTMRELAARLGVSHGALYRWVGNREELIDLISEVVVDRVLPPYTPDNGSWQSWLAHLGWAMHDQFLAIPGYATHLSRPHRHNARAFERLRTAIITAFTAAGAGPDLAEQSYYIFLTSVVGWLAVPDGHLHFDSNAPRFELFVDTLLRGLPAREPGLERQ